MCMEERRIGADPSLQQGVDGGREGGVTGKEEERRKTVFRV